MKWQIISLTVSLSFLIIMCHIPYKCDGIKSNQTVNSSSETKKLFKENQNMAVRILAYYEIKSKQTVNSSSETKKLFKGNQDVAVKMLASTSLTFKVTTGLFFYRYINLLQTFTRLICILRIFIGCHLRFF